MTGCAVENETSRLATIHNSVWLVQEVTGVKVQQRSDCIRPLRVTEPAEYGGLSNNLCRKLSDQGYMWKKMHGQIRQQLRVAAAKKSSPSQPFLLPIHNQ